MLNIFHIELAVGMKWVSLLDFPLQDKEQLRSLTCGSYCSLLQLDASYTQEHIEGGYFRIHTSS